MPVRIGFHLDPILRLRCACGGVKPDVARCAAAAANGGADWLVAPVHEAPGALRGSDIGELRSAVPIPITLDLMPSADVLTIVDRFDPDGVCLVSASSGRTAGGALDVKALPELGRSVTCLAERVAELSVCIEPCRDQIVAAHAAGVRSIRFHAGRYAASEGEVRQEEFVKLYTAAAIAADLGMACEAGHGLGLDSVGPLAAIESLTGIVVGRAIIAEGLVGGIETVLNRWKALVRDEVADP